jgi:parafibromin
MGLVNSQKQRSEKESNVFGHILSVTDKVRKADAERTKRVNSSANLRTKFDEKTVWNDKGVDHDHFKINTHGTFQGASFSSEEAKKTPKVKKRPIIVVPAALSSLITIHNANELLVGSHYYSNEEMRKKETRKDSHVIRRSISRTQAEEYIIIDNPTKLHREDWDRIVAVFTNGQAWQFSGWKDYNDNPVKLFEKYQGFHLAFAEDEIAPNVKNWNIKILTISKHETKRHNDQTAVREFWKTLDEYMKKKEIEPVLVNTEK